MGHIERLKKVQNSLSHDQAVLVEDKVNMLYLIGKELSAGKLLFTAQSVFLFADGRYYQQMLGTPGIEVILWNGDRWKEFLKKEIPHITTLEFSATSMTYSRYQELKGEFLGELIPAKNRIELQRCIKDAEEIKRMKEAAVMGSSGFDYVCTLLKEGITEIKVAAELDIFWKRQGAEGCAFSPIIAFGANSAYPHYHPGHIKLKKGDTVLIDIGVTLNHYHSDMTRVVFYGEPDPKMKEIYNIVQKAQETAVALAKPGITVGELDKVARQLITDAGYGENFSHGLGHGIGLEVHEIPYLRSYGDYGSTVLEAGMFVTIEPGIYLPGLGGVRIEDTILITESGSDNLTNRSKRITFLGT